MKNNKNTGEWSGRVIMNLLEAKGTGIYGERASGQRMRSWMRFCFLWMLQRRADHSDFQEEERLRGFHQRWKIQYGYGISQSYFDIDFLPKELVKN